MTKPINTPTIIPFMMGDIETLDTKPTAVVLTIGAAAMDANGDIMETYHAHLNIQNQLDRGRTVSASTIGWWLGQSDEARKDVRASFDNEIPLAVTLIGFNQFIARCEKHGATAFYSNGPEFDAVILQSLYNTAGVTWPVKHWNIRSFREMKTRFPDQGPAFVGEKHNALADAIHQANWLWNIELYLAEHGV